MRILRTTALAVITALVLVITGSGGVALAATPSGAALVHLAAASATLTPVSAGTYHLIFTDTPSVSWLGEVTNAQGKQRLLTGAMAPHRLAGKWSSLRLKQQRRARATLTWNTSSATQSYSVVQLSKPAKNSAGQVTFEIQSSDDLPATMADVTVNIDRATGKRARGWPVSIAYVLAASLQANTLLRNAFSAQVSIVGANTKCYVLTLTQAAPRMQLPAGLTCAGTTFNSGTLSMTIPGVSTQGNVFMATTMTPSDQAPFQFNSVISTWTQAGSS